MTTFKTENERDEEEVVYLHLVRGDDGISLIAYNDAGVQQTLLCVNLDGAIWRKALALGPAAKLGIPLDPSEPTRKVVSFEYSGERR
jgi:hypothetical protein